MLTLLVLLVSILKIHSSSAEPLRLPDVVKPDLYDLQLIFDTRSDPKFYGTVNIKVTCVKQTRTIVLHASTEYGLHIFSDEVVVTKLDTKKDEIPVKSTVFDPPNELMNINLMDDLIPTNEYIITIRFEGFVSDKTKGFILLGSSGKYLIAANFKRTLARTVFPCFDEPALKAKFRLSIQHMLEDKTISNTPLSEQHESTESPGWWIDTYFSTPLISTYQLSFVVYGIRMEENNIIFQATHGIPVSFVIKKVLNKLAEPGSELTAFGLQLITEGYKLPTITPQVLKKIDYLVMPGSENVDAATLGLIINSESQYFMGSSKENTQPMLHLIYEGLVKQWFGVALTPEWWDAEWLLNCLARYVPLFILPDNYIKQDVLPQMFAVMDWDSQPDTEKVNKILQNNGALEKKDSDNKFNKGLMLLHMLHKTIGIAGFNLGVQDFARKYTSKTVSVDDFWKTIDGYSSYKKGFWRFKTTVVVIPNDVGTKQIMSSWTDQEGYPIVNVERTGTNVKVTQARFFSDKRSPLSKTDNKQCWWIPLSYTTEAKPSEFHTTEPKKWLGCNEKYTSSIELSNVVKENHWIIFNNKLSGLYRVNYDKVGWGRITDALKNHKRYTDIHPFNRAQLVNDALALSWKNDLDFDTAFKLLSYLSHETDLFVWKSYFMGVINLTEYLKRSPVNEDFKMFMRGMLTKVYETEFPTKDTILNYIKDDSNPADASTKLLVNMWSCGNMVPKCISHSKEIVNEWEKTGKIEEVSMPFSKGLVMSVMCSAMFTDQGEKVFQFVFNKYKALDKADANRELYVEVLACTRSNSAVKTLLDWSTSTTTNEVIKEKISVFNSLIAEKFSFEQTQQYFYKNSERIRRYFSSAASTANQAPFQNILWMMASEMNVSEVDQLTIFIKNDRILRIMVWEQDLRKWKSDAQAKQQWLDFNSKSLKDALSSVNG